MTYPLKLANPDALKMSRCTPVVFAVLLFSASLVTLLPVSVAQGSTAMVVPAGITLSTNEAIYTLGETVQVSGRVLPPLDLNNLLRITIIMPDEEIFRIDEFEINNDGLFVWSFNLPTSQTGEWNINVRFSTKGAETAITVRETDLFAGAFIQDPMLTDVQGRNITSGGVRVGANTAITATLVNDEDEPQPFMYIVQIIDNDGVSNSLLLAPGSLPSGQSVNPSVGWLPREEGTYMAEIFVWSSLNNPTPLVEKQVVTFSVSSE